MCTAHLMLPDLVLSFFRKPFRPRFYHLQLRALRLKIKSLLAAKLFVLDAFRAFDSDRDDS